MIKFIQSLYIFAIIACGSVLKGEIRIVSLLTIIASLLWIIAINTSKTDSK